MLQQDKPDDYVIATGKQYSVRDFVNAAAAELGFCAGKGEDKEMAHRDRGVRAHCVAPGQRHRPRGPALFPTDGS